MYNLIVFITWNFSGCRANKFCLNCRFSLADGENGRLARETATQESALWAKQQRAGSPKPLLCNLLTLSALSQTSRLECTSWNSWRGGGGGMLSRVQPSFLQPPLFLTVEIRWWFVQLRPGTEGRRKGAKSLEKSCLAAPCNLEGRAKRGQIYKSPSNSFEPLIEFWMTLSLDSPITRCKVSSSDSLQTPSASQWQSRPHCYMFTVSVRFSFIFRNRGKLWFPSKSSLNPNSLFPTMWGVIKAHVPFHGGGFTAKAGALYFLRSFPKATAF